MRPDTRPQRTVVGLLLLAAITIITLDARHDSSSPVDPLRTAVGYVMGPAEEAAAAVMAPVTSLPDRFDDVDELQNRVDELEAANAELTTQLHAADANAQRSSEVDGIAEFADATGYDILQAQVVATGTAQSW